MHKCYFRKKGCRKLFTVFAGPYYSFKGRENSTKIKNQKLPKE